MAKNIGKRFERDWIFRNLSACFEMGNIYAIIGPNGSGKSTLMQILWGQMLPSSGIITYTTQNEIIPPQQIHRHLAVATQYMSLIEEFTLAEVIRFHFSFKGMKHVASHQELMDDIKLSHKKNKRIDTFSSGMKQRVKLALAFYSDVSILFFDEPTVNLDKTFSDWYRNRLKKIAPRRLTFIASNQLDEYPSDAQKIDLTKYK